MNEQFKTEYEQGSLFDFAYPAFTFEKPIRLIELFAGYGSQKLAMEYLNANCESWRICEWAIPSFEAYKAIHAANDDKDYSDGLPKEDLARFLFEKGVSADWNKPLSLASLQKKPLEYLKNAYNAIKATNNLCDISKTSGRDFAMENRKDYDVVMTYSFPCQDLSLAGKGLGMNEGSGTRSSLLWQVKRILSELNDLKQLPTVLLMENVPQVANAANKDNMAKWQSYLSELGYKTYIEILCATDYGIPQIRKRAFMVSVLGDYSFRFPGKKALKERLMDFFEKDIPQRYYLTDEQVSKIVAWKSYRNPISAANDQEDAAANTITATSNMRANASMALIREGLPIINNTKKGYEIAEAGDGVYIRNAATKRGMVQKDKIQTIKAGIDCGVVVCGIDRTTKNAKLREYANCITANENRGTSCRGSNRTGVLEISPKIEQIGNLHQDIGGFKNRTDGRIYNPSCCSPTLGTMAGGNKQPFVMLKESVFTEEQANMFDENLNVKRYIGDSRTDTFKEGQIADISFPRGYNKGCRVHNEAPALNTTTTMSSFVVKQSYRIRKLTPLECWRLMGVKDSDFSKVKSLFPDSVLYHLAGDSIVTTCLMGIFHQLGAGNGSSSLCFNDIDDSNGARA